MKNRYRVSSGRIRSLQDLELEKAKMEIELLKSEESIKFSYRQLVHKLTFRNLAGTLVDEISKGTSTLSSAISLGKSFLEKRKKKKREKAMYQEMTTPVDKTTLNQENPSEQ
ncbi:MAG: hypothetical protein WCO93_06165 [bacterium]